MLVPGHCIKLLLPRLLKLILALIRALIDDIEMKLEMHILTFDLAKATG